MSPPAQAFVAAERTPRALGELLATLPPGQLLALSGARSTIVDHFTQDSRAVAPGGLFVATRGSSWDGHAFIGTALDAGAAAIVAESPRPEDRPLAPRVAWVQVADGLVALAHIAAAWYGHPGRDVHVLATTGTNGKTTTTFLLRAILEAWGKRVGLVSTVEIAIAGEQAETIFTTPPAPEFQKLLAMMRARACSHAVVEASSHGLHQHRIAAFPVAVAGFTNLSRDHLDYHHTMDAYEAAKARLFTDLAERACVCVDEPAGRRMADRFRARFPVTDRLVTVSTRGEPATLSATSVRSDLDGLSAEIACSLPGAPPTLRLQSPLIGRHNVENTLVALGMAHLAGVPLTTALAALTTAAGAPGRLQRVARPDGAGPTCFVDYAHTPDALANVLGALGPLVHARGGRLVCVFGAGGDRDPGKRPEMAAIAAAHADRVVATSDNPRTEDPEAILDAIAAGFPAGFPFTRVTDRRAAITTAIAESSSHDAVLIAGKGHEPYQIIGTTRHPFDDAAVVRAALEGWG